MPDYPLDVGDDLSCIGLVPPPIELFGNRTELDDKIARKVPRPNFAPFPFGSGLWIVLHSRM
jgi:hypothetical protein